MWEPEFARLQLMTGFEESDTAYRYPIAPISDALFIASPAAWKIAGIAVKIAEVDGHVSFYLNGQKLLTWTGDTRIYRANDTELLDTITGVYWFGDEWNVTHSDEYWPMGEWGVNTYVDDLVIESLTEGDIVDAEPPYRALLWAPVTANGSITQWTKVNADTNAAAVADGLPDDGDSYVTTGEAGQKDEYLIAAPSLTGYLPEVVTVIARGKRATTARSGAGAGTGRRLERDRGDLPRQARHRRSLGRRRYRSLANRNPKRIGDGSRDRPAIYRRHSRARSQIGRLFSAVLCGRRGRGTARPMARRLLPARRKLSSIRHDDRGDRTNPRLVQLWSLGMQCSRPRHHPRPPYCYHHRA
jgi:hypothetical protein